MDIDIRPSYFIVFMLYFKAAWLVKCKAVIRQNYIDDIELDEESVADIVMDENAVASMPR
jgi:tetratricopeptide repeat protein 8